LVSCGSAALVASTTEAKGDEADDDGPSSKTGGGAGWTWSD
jgi:hypothetical protein